MVRMRLGGLFAMMFGVDVMGVGEMRVMGGVFVLAVFVMLGGVTVMLGGFRMMVGGVGVMFGSAFGVRHGSSPHYAPDRARGDHARLVRRDREGFMSGRPCARLGIQSIELGQSRLIVRIHGRNPLLAARGGGVQAPFADAGVSSPGRAQV